MKTIIESFINTVFEDEQVKIAYEKIKKHKTGGQGKKSYHLFLSELIKGIFNEKYEIQ